MYVIYDGRSYIGATANNTPSCVGNRKKALTFDTLEKANNYINNIKATMRKFPWQVVCVGRKDNCSETDTNSCDNEIKPPCDPKSEMKLNQFNFNVAEFFNTTIETVSQLDEYAKNMRELEESYNGEIMDVRHYKRDPDTKLNAIQLQRLEQFEIQLEKERYECKSNRLIAELFLGNLNKLKDRKMLHEIQKIKNSKYRPRSLSFEAIDEIVGKVKK